MDKHDGGSQHSGHMIDRRSQIRAWLRNIVVLALAALSACVSVHYPRPGPGITPRAGGHVSYSEFDVKSVDMQPIEIARATLEQRLGTLPEPPVVAPWCAGNDLPAFDDPGLADRARLLLDRGCPATR